MRYLYCKLVGYAGIYNGLGLYEIELDFSKCKNKITVISGPNGVGKSTIIKALSLMPDGNQNFVSSMAASKILRLQDNNNIYDIQIIHGLDKNNNRQVSKAFIQKNGEELNSNGNISSYKDIIFTEFNMDSNYLELFKISGEDRGIADKKPAERKKIIAARISSLEVYNNIYKTLNKKANIFKSHINTLSSKIQNVGDESNLRNTLAAIDLKHKRLVDSIEKAKEQIIETKTELKLNDPNGEMKAEYDQVQNDIINYENIEKNTYSIIFKILNDLNIKKEEVDKKLEIVDRELSIYEEDFNRYNKDKEVLLSRIDYLSKEKDNIQIKLDKLKSNIGDDISNTIDEYRNKVYSIEQVFNNLGINSIDDISKDEIDHAISIFNDISYLIDDLQVYDLSRLSKIVNTNISKELEDLKKDKENHKEALELLRQSISDAKKDYDLTSILNDRPKTCKDDTCPFISNALNITSKYSAPIIDVISNMETNIQEQIDIITILDKTEEDLQISLNIQQKFLAITKLINSNKKILSKFSISKRILNEKHFIKDLESNSSFNDIKSASQYSTISNEIIEYKSYKKVLNKLEAQYIVYSNNKSQINEYEFDLEKIQIEYDDLFKDLDVLKDMITEVQDKATIASNNKYTLIDLQEKIKIYEDNNEKLQEARNKKESLESKFASSFNMMEKISDLEVMIKDNTSELEPIENDKKVIEQQLTLLDSYKQEYGEYKTKYDVVDKLRKYSSPTSGSIQSLFMSIYMDKTLDMVNQLLSMLFGGQYKVLQYVINEDEFRIPFIGNGMMVDDISSGSTSQICMMGMIINLVIANTSSGNYNIVSLDEIDGGLDHLNRYMFVDVLQRISDILQLDQIFIISHSVESALSNVDVILLSNNEEYKDQFNNTNIIYQTGG